MKTVQGLSLERSVYEIWFRASELEHPAVDFLVEQVYGLILSPSLKPREAVLRHEVWRESLFHGWVCWEFL